MLADKQLFVIVFPSNYKKPPFQKAGLMSYCILFAKSIHLACLENVNKLLLCLFVARKQLFVIAYPRRLQIIRKYLPKITALMTV